MLATMLQSVFCVACAATVLTLGPRVPGTAPDDAIVRGELGAKLDDWLERMEAFGMHGALLVEVDDDVVLAKGYGVAQHATGRRITSETSFHLGSLGKQFTAACILKLEMQGRLSVDDSIADHLGGVPEDKRAITIHHLLTHTSGLPYLPEDGSPLELPLSAAPGERWRYSNPGYTILGRIVERVGGMPLARFAALHLFEPAGMSQTTYVGDPDWPTSDVAHSYQDDEDLGPVSEDVPDPAFLGAGGVASSVGDLLRWEHALRGEAILTDAAKAEFFTEHVRNPGASVGYAYGWMTTTTERGTRLVFHQGNFGGFNSDYRRYVDEGVTIVFLSNHYRAGRSMRDAVVNNVSRLIGGGVERVPMPPRTVPGETGAAALATTFETVFPVPPDGRIEAARDGDSLLLRGWGQEAQHLVFAPDAGDAARAFAELANERSVEAVRAVARGDQAGLREHLSRSVMADQLWRGLTSQFERWSGTLGALTDVESLGTALTGQDSSGHTTVRLTFEGGEQLAQFAWGASGGIYQMTPEAAPPSRSFLTCESGLVAFDIFTGQASSVSLEADGDGWTMQIGGQRFESGP